MDASAQDRCLAARRLLWAEDVSGGNFFARKGDVQELKVPSLALTLPTHPAQEHKTRDCQTIPAALLLVMKLPERLSTGSGEPRPNPAKMVFDNKDL
jgi:hypothetical protein